MAERPNPSNLIRVMPAKGQDIPVATSVFLARLIGPLCAAIGLALLFSPEAFRTLARAFLDRPELIFLAGLITLPAGLAVVLTHNVWAADWRLIITILGWLAAISGFIRLVAPHRAAHMGREMLTRKSTVVISGAGYLAVGAVLCFFGYLRH